MRTAAEARQLAAQALYARRARIVAPPPVRDPQEVLTPSGKMAFLIGASLFLSAVPQMRPTIVGLSFHPYLLLLAAALPLALNRGRHLRGRGLGRVGVILMVALLASALTSSDVLDGLKISFKWLTMGFTFFVFERLILTRRDARFAAYGIITGVTLIALRGLLMYRSDPTYYIEVMRGIGSRNVYSLWTLVPMTFCLLLLTSKALPLKAKAFVASAFAALVIPQVLSLSRSGWVVIILIAALVLTSRRSMRLLVVIVAVGLLLEVSIQQMSFEEKIEARFEELRQGTHSDSLRKELVIAGLKVFLSNPLFGVSQVDLPRHLGSWEFGPTSSHNLYIEVLAGTGLLGTVPLVACVIVMLRRWRRCVRRGLYRYAPEMNRALLILLAATALRATTSDEILYCPSIILGLATAHGLNTLLLATHGANAGPRPVLLARGPLPRPGRRPVTQDLAPAAAGGRDDG